MPDGPVVLLKLKALPFPLVFPHHQCELTFRECMGISFSLQSTDHTEMWQSWFFARDNWKRSRWCLGERESTSAQAGPIPLSEVGHFFI